ncbi:hypothetical protein LCGC14_0567200 [marine sediment metagenome]|uniref:CBM-cenC domain-containing protein n=1 Tax=marine sediment metagenome TaxID=412755 RepID=A0A0F9UTH0_9ZZZZ
MSKGGLKYDISLERTDGTDVGLMLAEDKNGHKLYRRFDDPALAQQYFTGEPSYGALPPEKELALTQSTYDSGYGLEFADSIDKKRYYLSKGADARFRDNIICGPKATGIAITDYSYGASITDGGLEIWTNSTTLTNWTNVTLGTINRESTIVYAGTYSAKIGTNQDGYLKQSITWDVGFRNQEVTFFAYCQADLSANATGFLSIYDGIGTTNGTSLAVDDTWTRISVTRTISGNATELQIRLNYDYISSSASVYFDAVVWGGPTHGNPKAFAEFNDVWYMAYGDTLVKLNATGDGWTFVKSMGSVITDLVPFSDGNLYILLGASAKYFYMSTSESFTQSTLAGAVDGYMLYAAVRGTASGQTMVKGLKPRSCYKSTDPTNAGSWGTILTVGNASEDITDMIGDTDTIYIGKEDTAWYFDTSDDDFALVEDMQSLKRSDNAKNLLPWHTKVYIPAGENGLVEYDGGTITWRSPSLYSTNLSDFAGQVQALAADEDYLYAILDNTTKLEIVAGQLRTVDGSVLWAWHPIQQITLTGCETAKVTSVYKKRLWIASTSSSDSVWWISLTTKYGDITGDTNYSFQTGGYVITSWLHANLKADNKAYFKLTLTTEGCDATNYITVDYQTYFTALTGTWTNLGNFITSPSQTKYFSSVTGEMIRFRFTLVTDATSTTPKLVNYDCRGIWRPTRRMLIATTVKLADEHKTRDGSEESETYTSMKDAIEEAINKVWPNTFYDIDSKGSTKKYVACISAMERNVKWTEGQKSPESLYDLLLEEITLS